MIAGKVVLFLQGPHSVFFSRLADRLEQLGHRCLRINLSFADWLFWQRPGAHHYRGSLNKWSAFLDGFYDTHAVTDIVLLGEQREHHKIAIELAKLRGIHVTVTDWGYLRPDWLTFERDGMSGSTHFTRDPAEIVHLGATAPEPDFSLKYPESFPWLGFCNVCGDIGNWLFALLYPGHRSHLLVNPVTGYISTGWRMFHAKRREPVTQQVVRQLVNRSKDQPFFVFPLQMEGDFQIRAYSRYSDLYTAIYEVLDSFARRAGRADRLAIKLHPWDTGLRPWRKISLGLARKFGVASRVEFLDGGSLDELLSAAKGMVTINSTSGMGALRRGVPVRVLGECVYDVPGLTAQCALDDFWQAPPAPDPNLCNAFVRAMASCIQIKGGFFSKRGVEAAVEVAAARLSNGLVNRPLQTAGQQTKTDDFGSLGEQAVVPA